MTIRELSGRERPRARRRRWLEECVDETPVRPLAPQQRLEHDLTDALRHWATLPNRGAIERDALYRKHRDEIRGLLQSYQWDLRPANATSTAQPGRLRAVAWNLERGKRWSALCGVLDTEPKLHELDLLLLSEVDLGMGRSDNRDVAAELAERLGMGYVFAPSHLVMSEGAPHEVGHGRHNTLALHGLALLTRFPVRKVVGVPLPEYADKLHAVERRFGAKRALLAELDTPQGPLTVAAVHLDPYSPPRHRATQMERIMRTLTHLHGHHVLLGGDLNTSTYDFGGAMRLAIDVGRKLWRYGFAGTVANYMIPDKACERPVFEVLERAGFAVEGFVDPERGTIYYDMYDPDIIDHSQRVLPGPFYRWLMQRLEPWGGVVPLRMDWFLGRGVEPLDAWTVVRPRHDGMHVSDHDPVGVEIAWPPSNA